MKFIFDILDACITKQFAMTMIFQSHYDCHTEITHSGRKEAHRHS